MRSSFHGEQTTRWYARVVCLIFAAWNVLTRIRVSSKRIALDAWFLRRVDQRRKDGVRFDGKRDEGATFDLNKDNGIRSSVYQQKGHTLMCQCDETCGSGRKRGTNCHSFLRTFLVRWNASVKLLGTRRETACSLVSLLRERFARTRCIRILIALRRLTIIAVQVRKRKILRMFQQWTSAVSILAIGRLLNNRRNLRQMGIALYALIRASSETNAPELRIPNEMRRSARSAILIWHDAAYELCLK